jgi:hypothetical protein
MGRNFAAHHSRFVSPDLLLKSLFVELLGHDGKWFEIASVSADSIH